MRLIHDLGVEGRCVLVSSHVLHEVESMTKRVLLMDHGRVAPPGLFGGHDGARNEVVLEQDGRTYISPHWSKDEDIRVKAGDLITVRTPGGGGYGDPLDRDPALVCRDVARGYFTVEDAERDYGVVLRGAPPAVDVGATARLRESRARL